MEEEGVIKFSSEHERARLRAASYGDLARRLGAWREILIRTDLVGQAEDRYGGAGFGNLSARINPPSLPRGRRKFLITGTQTGGKAELVLDDYCVVHSYCPRGNSVRSLGMVRPSSESMTHAAIYDLSPHIRFVFHAHSPAIWKRARELRLPTTGAEVAYGTPAMAREVQRLYRESALPERRVLAMAGHEDGVLAFGHRAEDAGLALIQTLAAACG